MAVAVIPARGGSKRIADKNIRPFCGKPMIAWSIETALRSGCFDRVVVSTDSERIAETAIAHGAEVPFVRPAHLSDDHATTLDVMQHAVETLSLSEPVCCIYATAPFTTEEDLTRAYTTFRSGNWNYVFSATTFAFPVQRALKQLPTGGTQMLYPEHAQTRSQDLEEAWHDAGQFYWGKAEAFAGKLPVFSAQSTICPLPRSRVQDIDTPEDWDRAELMFKALGLDQTPGAEA